MNNVNFLKPNKENLNLYLVLGALFFTLGIVDFCLNNFYKTNITGFLPGYISFFSPLILVFIFLLSSSNNLIPENSILIK